MSVKTSERQEKMMQITFRGTRVWRQLNTGFVDEHVRVVREYVANIFFYTKNGKTIMIDAGYNYPRLKEKMSWLEIDPGDISEILLTHIDTDHTGALEEGSEGLFKDAKIYLGEIENGYLTGERTRRVMYGLYALPKVVIPNEKVLLKDGEVFFIGDIKIECILTPGHTIGHMVYLIDDKYLFTGDTIWLGIDGGYSFLSTLAWSNKAAKESLVKLENLLRERNIAPIILTGHTGWTDDLDFAFAKKDKVCGIFTKRLPDPQAPYDAYDESDDTEENTRKGIPLPKKITLKDQPAAG